MFLIPQVRDPAVNAANITIKGLQCAFIAVEGIFGMRRSPNHCFVAILRELDAITSPQAQLSADLNWYSDLSFARESALVTDGITPG